MKSILRLAEMSNLSALSILFVSVLNEVVVSFLGYIIWMEYTSSAKPFKFVQPPCVP